MSSALISEPGLGQPQSMVPSNQQLSRNPMLPQHPLGAYTDSEYEASDALLRRQVAQQYADLLQQLGYVDENGQFIQGSVEAEANKQNTNYQRQQQLATEQVTKEAQNNGTLFSGIRGTLQGRAEDPFVRARADLMAATPLSLQQLYEHAAGLSGDYVLQQNQQLAAAAARRAQGIITDPGIGSTGVPTPPAPPTDTTPAPTAGASVIPTLFAPGGPGTIPQTAGGAPVLEHAPGIPVIYPPQISPQQQAANAMMAMGLTPAPARNGPPIAV